MFIKKLTTAMQKSTGWRDLAGLLSELNDQVTEPLLERAAGFPSIFQMADEDLDIRLDELGEYVRFGQFGDEDKAMVVQQRLDEIHLKDTLYPLKKTLARELSGTEIEWAPLYNHSDAEYGVGLSTDTQIVDKTGWWLTSRGVLRVNISSLGGVIEKDVDSELESVKATIEKLAKPLIPLDIVYDGIVFVSHIAAKEAYERAVIKGMHGVDAATSAAEAPEAGVVSLGLESLRLPGPFVLSHARFDECGLDSVAFDADVKRQVKESAMVGLTELGRTTQAEAPERAVSLQSGALSLPERMTSIDSVNWTVITSWEEASSVSVESVMTTESELQEIAAINPVSEISLSVGTESLQQAVSMQSAFLTLPEQRIWTQALVDAVTIDAVTLDAIALDAYTWTIAPSWEGATITNLTEDE